MADHEKPEELNEQELEQAVGGATAAAKTGKAGLTRGLLGGNVGETAVVAGDGVVLSSETHEPSIRKR